MLIVDQSYVSYLFCAFLPTIMGRVLCLYQYSWYISSENPEVLEAMQTKSEGLHDRLKNVYLESKGDNSEVNKL